MDREEQSQDCGLPAPHPRFPWPCRKAWRHQAGDNGPLPPARRMMLLLSMLPPDPLTLPPYLPGVPLRPLCGSLERQKWVGKVCGETWVGTGVLHALAASKIHLCHLPPPKKSFFFPCQKLLSCPLLSKRKDLYNSLSGRCM